MIGGRARQLLEQALAEMGQARRHLDYSFAQVAPLPEPPAQLDERQLESVEAFASRFSRAVDLLVNKLLRSLDRVELFPEGSLLDVVNRAEKRGFVGRAAELRELKEVRNVIAHDYAGARAAEIFAFCRQQKPAFDAIADRACDYARHLLAT